MQGWINDHEWQLPRSINQIFSGHHALFGAFKRRLPWTQVLVSGPRFFKGSLLAYASLALLVASGLAKLGFWQLERAQQKQHLLDSIDQAVLQQPVDLLEALKTYPDPLFRSVRATGHFLSDRQLLLDNQVRSGHPGVQAYVPLLLDHDGSLLLVDRGWLAWPDRSLPLPQATVSSQQVTLEGILLSPPAAGMALGAQAEQGWPLLMTRMDLADLERRFQQPLLDWVLEDLATPRTQSIRAGMLPPERHRGYAVQWFALSLTILIIFGVLTLQSWRAQRPSRP